MKIQLDIEQTDKILKKLRDYGLEVVDMEDCPKWMQQPIVSEDYFNEKVNEALEEE